MVKDLRNYFEVWDYNFSKSYIY